MADSLDKKLMDLLSQNARQSSQGLARQLDVSSSTVRRRIDKLVKQGVLHFVALTDPAKTGFAVKAMIAFDVAHDKMNDLMNALSSRREVGGLAATTGRFDILAVACFTSTEALFQFMEGEVPNLAGVKNTETFICLHVQKGFWPPIAQPTLPATASTNERS